MKAASATIVIALWWYVADGIEPYTGDKFACETGEARAASPMKDIARPIVFHGGLSSFFWLGGPALAGRFDALGAMFELPQKARTSQL